MLKYVQNNHKDIQMPNNGLPPNDISTFFALVWVLAISFWGGTVHTIRKIKDGTLQRFTISEWVGDVVISGFIGVMTYSICRYSDFDGWLTAACVGITSHMGTRGLLFMERWLAVRFGINTKEVEK